MTCSYVTLDRTEKAFPMKSQQTLEHPRLDYNSQPTNRAND